MKEVIKVEQLTAYYEKTVALWEISFSLTAGQIVAIVGPNGAGKSTLLKAILQLIPKRGSVEIASGLSVSYIPQYQSVDWDFPLTVYDLVMMGRYSKLRWFSRRSAEDKRIVEECLLRVGLSAFRKRQIAELSGGQQSRAFLARSLVAQADLYLLDEPFAGIDEASAQVIMEILLELKREGKTVIVVHHDLQEVKERFESVILLNRRLVACGSSAEVMIESNLRKAYGRENLLFDEAHKLTKQKAMGL